MRIATYAQDGSARAAVVAGDDLHPFPFGVTVTELLEQGALAEAARAARRETAVPLARCACCRR